MADSESRLVSFSPFIKNVLEYKISIMPYCKFYDDHLFFKCFVCGHTKGVREELLWHLFQHLNNRCQFCEYWSATKINSIEKHVKKKHAFQLKNEKLKCPYCDEKRPTYGSLHEHCKSHFRHTCIFCSEKTVTQKELASHLGSKHQTELKDGYNCSVFHSTHQQLITHLRKVAKLGFVCLCCGMAFHDKLQLKIHYRIFGSNHTSRVPPRYITTPSSVSETKDNQNIENGTVVHLRNDKEIISLFKDILNDKIAWDYLLLNQFTVGGEQLPKRRCPGRCRNKRPLPSNEHAIFRHIQNDLLLACHNCMRLCQKPSVFTNHMRWNFGCGKEFKCFVCKLLFVNSAEYLSHYRLHLLKRVCIYCAQTFPTGRDTAVHRERVHYKTRFERICEKCGKKCKSPAALRTHINSVHRAVGEVNDLVKLCHVCGVFGNRFLHKCLKKSVLVAEDDTKNEFICDYCGKIFPEKQRLSTHIKAHMNEKSFICKTCKKGFNRETSLRKHVKDMHSARKFLCPNSGCESAFSFKSGLLTHINRCSKSTKSPS